MSDRKINDAVIKAIEEMGLLSEHKTALRTLTPYAFKMEFYVGRELLAASRRPTPSQALKSMDRQSKAVNEEIVQARFDLPDDQIVSRRLDDLIEGLERRLQVLKAPEVLFVDENGNGCTLRGAVGQIGLWEQAFRAIQSFAAMKRNEAELANSCVQIASEIARRARKEGWRD